MEIKSHKRIPWPPTSQDIFSYYWRQTCNDNSKEFLSLKHHGEVFLYWIWLGDGKLMKSGLQRIKKARTRLDSEILTGINENLGTMLVISRCACIKVVFPLTPPFHINIHLNKRKSLADRRYCLFCPEVKECILPSEYDSKVPVHRRLPAYDIWAVFIDQKQDSDGDHQDGDHQNKRDKRYKEFVMWETIA